MQTLVSPRSAPPPDAAMREDWFFGQHPESFLAQWQRRAKQKPRLYLWLFSIFWPMWPLTCMVAIHGHDPPMVAVLAAAHIGYSAIVFGAILSPRQNWWLPIGLIAGPFALTLPSVEMQPSLRGWHGHDLGAVTFALNMALGLTAAYLAQRLAPRIFARQPQISHVVAILCALFVNAALVAVAMHRSERPHLPALDLRISYWSETDPFGHILFHGYLINVAEEYAREPCCAMPWRN